MSLEPSRLWPRLAVLAVLFLLVRIATIAAYRDTLYYYGLVSHQFAIAEATYHGHGFAHDAVLSEAAVGAAKREGRFIPLEEWSRFRGSGLYTTFPAADLPGLGYLIAFTSRWLDERLSTRWAHGIQLLVELLSVLTFVCCAALGFGDRTALLAGSCYVLAYPFIWPLASLPMRDIFVMGVYASFIAASFVFLSTAGWRSLLIVGLLIAIGSLLLWVRPHGYYVFLLSLPLAVFVRKRSPGERVAFAALLLLVPWLVFGYPLRLFNLRHYGVPATDAIGRTLWQHMGIATDNPYGFVLKDEAMLPWIKAHYGRDVEYASPEMNRLLGDYARRVIREHPAFYFKTVALSCLEMARTPLDFVPPFPLVDYSSSGLTL